eukprot:scaffold113178_cov19-Tisochrysis_lutea.AAC.1
MHAFVHFMRSGVQHSYTLPYIALPSDIKCTVRMYHKSGASQRGRCCLLLCLSLRSISPIAQ